MNDKQPPKNPNLPDFTLPDHEGNPWKLSAQLEHTKKLILVFFRGDWWPYCNGQLVSFARKYQQFEQHQSQVVGISVDSIEKNTAMIAKLLLPFSLLSDEEGKVIKEYGVWDEKGEISRTALFVVGKDRQVHYRYVGEDFADRPGDQELFTALELEGEEQS